MVDESGSNAAQAWEIAEGTTLTREELFQDILTLRLEPDHLIYIERRGESYAWRQINPGTNISARPENEPLPEAWIYYSGPWPSENDDLGRWRNFFDDLLAEMESMAGGVDRCRWPFDEPWPQRH